MAGATVPAVKAWQAGRHRWSTRLSSLWTSFSRLDTSFFCCCHRPFSDESGCTSSWVCVCRSRCGCSGSWGSREVLFQPFHRPCHQPHHPALRISHCSHVYCVYNAQVRRAMARLSELPPEQAHFVSSVSERAFFLSCTTASFVLTLTRPGSPAHPSSLFLNSLSSLPCSPSPHSHFYYLARADSSNGSQQEWPKSPRHGGFGDRRQRPCVQPHIFACKNLDHSPTPR